MTISLTIPGEPKGKQRPRWAKHGTYTPKETVSYETYIKELFVVKYPDFVPMEGPLMMKLHLFVTIAASTSIKKKKHMASGDILPAKRPDLDNVVKIFCDALQGIAYKNDSQVVTLLAGKWYSDRPRAEIRIEET